MKTDETLIHDVRQSIVQIDDVALRHTFLELLDASIALLRQNHDLQMLLSKKRDGFPTIVCLCGSTRFGAAFHEANLRETLAGNIVLSIGCDFKSDADLLLAGEITLADKERVDELHLRKIDLADEVLFLNVGGYMGPSTKREFEYVAALIRAGSSKVIRWLEKPDWWVE